MTDFVKYKRVTVRPDGSRSEHVLTLELPYITSGQDVFDRRNVGELINRWNAMSVAEFPGRAINRYEYALVEGE